MVGTVLIADCDASSRSLLREALEQDGYHVATAADRSEALAYVCAFDVVIADVRLDLVGVLQARFPWSQIVVLTESCTLDEALASIKRGAYDYVLRPYYVEDVSLTVACAAANSQRGKLGTLDSVFGHVAKTCKMEIIR